MFIFHPNSKEVKGLNYPSWYTTQYHVVLENILRPMMRQTSKMDSQQKH